jgi:predicted O-methyltransferase YrrM
MLDHRFHERVETLRVPEMGTDCLAPMLYWLVRMVRPQRVLEIGAGYTTPFIAQALADNVAAGDAERTVLAAGDPAAELPLAHPDYYEQPHEPRLVCLDRMTDPTSSAPRVLAVLEQLGLTPVCEVLEGDLRSSAQDVRERLGPIDFAWVDVWDTLAFFRSFWDLVDPAGGVLALHWLLTYPQGRAILRYIESLRALEGGRLELTSIVEPHKFAQNSLTLVRRVAAYVDPHDLRPLGTANDPVGTLRI